jgi:hypothetical protein
MRIARLALMLAGGIVLARCASFDASPSAASADGGTDAITTDTSVEAEAPASDGGCGHLFCADFDDDAGLARWVPTVVAGNPPHPLPTIGIDSTASTTPPSSFVASTTSFTFGAMGLIEKSFDVASSGLGNGLRCTFDVQVLDAPAKGQSTLAAIAVGSSTGPAYAVHVDLVPGQRTRLYEAASGAAEQVYGPTLGGGWKTVALELRTGATPKFVVTVSADRYEVALKSLPPTIQSFALKIGIVFGNPYDRDDLTMRVRFDSVYCDAL